MSNSKYIIASPDELYHFKYIKRVRAPDGNWRYYYGDQATHKRIRQQIKDVRQLNRDAYANDLNARWYTAEAKKSASGMRSLIDTTRSSREMKTANKYTSASRDARNRADTIAKNLEYYTVGQTAKRNLSAARDKVSRKVNIARGRMKRNTLLAKSRLKKRFASIRDKFKRKR